MSSGMFRRPGDRKPEPKPAAEFPGYILEVVSDTGDRLQVIRQIFELLPEGRDIYTRDEVVNILLDVQGELLR